MEYLDVKNSRRSTEPSAQLSYASTGSEFAAFFAKKKPQRAKQSLFKYGSLLLIQHSILLWFIWKLFVQYYFILQWSPSFICKKSLKKEETNLSLTCLFQSECRISLSGVLLPEQLWHQHVSSWGSIIKIIINSGPDNPVAYVSLKSEKEELYLRKVWCSFFIPKVVVPCCQLHFAVLSLVKSYVAYIGLSHLPMPSVWVPTWGSRDENSTARVENYKVRRGGWG